MKEAEKNLRVVSTALDLGDKSKKKNFSCLIQVISLVKVIKTSAASDNSLNTGINSTDTPKILVKLDGSCLKKKNSF